MPFKECISADEIGKLDAQKLQFTSAVQFNFAALSICGGNCGTVTNEPGKRLVMRPKP